MVKSNVFFKTENNNMYIFNYHLNNVLICHPIFKYICNAYLSDDQESLDFYIKNGIELPGHGYFDKEEVQYYIRKYNFFLKVSLLKKISTNVEKKYIDKIEIIDYCKTVGGIVFETTEKCNLACGYCCYEKNYEKHVDRKSQDLDFFTAKTAIDYFIGLKTSYEEPFELAFYGGEPLLNFELIKKIIDYVDFKYSDKIIFIYRMTTNGTLLDKHIDF